MRAALGAGVALSASRRRAIAVNLLLSAAVTLVLLGGAEAICRRIEPPPADARRRTVQEWKAEAPGEHFYTMATDNQGWPPWQEFNRDGVRDRRHARTRAPGTRRLMFLGDSVTAGIGLAPEEAFPRVLEARYRGTGVPVEVFNVALWGWSTRQHRIAYRRIGRPYAADEVVLAVCLNDIQELEHQLARPPALLVALHERSALVRRVVGAHRRERHDVEQLVLGRRGFEHFFAEVRALRDEVQADGAAFKLMVFPYRFQYEPGAPPAVAQQAIADLCTRERIPFLDLLPDLRALGADAFIDDNHLSVDGSRRVADVLLERQFVTRVPSYTEVLGGRTPAQAIGAGDVEARRAAAWVLGRAQPSGATVGLLRKALADGDAGVIVEAARALETIGRPAAAAAPDLLRLLTHDRDDVRAQAARAAWAVGLTADHASVLLAAMNSEDEYVRHFAVWASGQIGAAGGEAVPALLTLLDQEEGHGAGTAAVSLRRLAAGDPGVVRGLAAGLTSPDDERRARAARNLGKLGPAAAPAVPDLLRTLGDGSEKVRGECVIALGRIEAGEAVPALVERLRKDGGWVREEAARALGRIGPAAAAAAPDLLHALERDEPAVRRQAARALGRVGRAETVRAGLEQALDDREETVREEAQRALDALRP